MHLPPEWIEDRIRRLRLKGLDSLEIRENIGTCGLQAALALFSPRNKKVSLVLFALISEARAIEFAEREVELALDLLGAGWELVISETARTRNKDVSVGIPVCNWIWRAPLHNGMPTAQSYRTQTAHHMMLSLANHPN